MTAQHRAGDAQLVAQGRGQRPRGLIPQPGHDRVEQHRALIVETLAAQRLADGLLPVAVGAAAGGGLAVLAHRPVMPRPAPDRMTVAARPAVHQSERRGGQRDEHSRMSGDILRDAVAAPQPGCQHLPQVALIQPRARRAHRRPPVPARHQQAPAGLVLAAHRADHLPGHRIGHGPPAPQPHRPGTPARRYRDRGHLLAAEYCHIRAGRLVVLAHRCIPPGVRGNAPAAHCAAGRPKGADARRWREKR